MKHVFGLLTSYAIGNSLNQLIGYTGPFFNYANALSYGESIGPDASWLNYPSYNNSAVLASVYSGVTFGAFPGKGDKYLGIKFISGSELHYGWIRLESDISPAYLIIKDYAYESKADFAIEAGVTISTGINELPAGAINIYSYGSVVFIINKINVQDVEAKIYDITGKLIANKILSDNITQIDLSGFSSGTYIVKIEGTKGIVNKEVFIN